jgi:RNA polymerase sigma-70 factor (ECF subfamily)
VGSGQAPSLDEVTVARALRGDRQALTAVYRALQPVVLRFLVSLGTPDAEDVAAEVWAGLARRMPSLRPDPAELRTMVLTIARRRAVDLHRRRLRHPADPVDDLPPSPVDGHEAVVDDRLRALALLQTLTPAVAEVVYLRAALGLPASEVGRITGRSEGAVRVMALRGLRQLRNGVGRPEAAVEPNDVTDGDPMAMVEG